MKTIIFTLTILLMAMQFCMAEEDVWKNNRLTVNQPFPAEVIAIATSWVGYELLLRELDAKEPRHCHVNVAINLGLHYTLTGLKASEKLLLNAPTTTWTMLPKPVSVNEFHYAAGAYKLGRNYGAEDLLMKAIGRKPSAGPGGDQPITPPGSKSGGKQSAPDSVIIGPRYFLCRCSRS